MSGRSSGSTRGNAVVETALMMTFIFMLLLGGIRLGIVGYTQAQADGATFIAAHSLARDSSATTSSVNSIVKTIFPTVSTTGASSLSMSTSSSQAYADYEPVLNLSILPGLTSAIRIRSHAVEAILPTPSATVGALNLSVPLVTLKNYVDATISGVSGTTGSYKFYVAQYVGSGNGKKNGRFDEWYCHYSTYASLAGDLPSTYPGSGYKVSGSLKSDLQTVYGWDSTSPGAASSC